MGGFGSTRWEGVATRSCVESCFTVEAPRGALSEGQQARAWWPRRGVTVRFAVLSVGDSPALSLWHAYEGGGWQHVALTSTPVNFGGRRWWFLCPACGARVRTLHMRGGPRSALGFRCRRCHDLTYESAQTSRGQSRAMFLGMARESGLSYREVRDTFRRAALNYGFGLYEPRRLYFEEARV